MYLDLVRLQPRNEGKYSVADLKINVNATQPTVVCDHQIDESSHAVPAAQVYYVTVLKAAGH